MLGNSIQKGLPFPFHSLKYDHERYYVIDKFSPYDFGYVDPSGVIAKDHRQNPSMMLCYNRSNNHLWDYIL